MQTLAIKVGDLMEQAIIIRNSEPDPDQGKRQNLEMPEKVKKWSFQLGQIFCHLFLRLQIKEVGSALQCLGRIRLSGSKNIRIGDQCIIGKNVLLETEGRGYIHIGSHVKIGKGVKIRSRNNITIEDHTYLGDYVEIWDWNLETEQDNNQIKSKPVYIGKNVWIGKDTRIHTGVTIGHGATISAKSVVIRSIPPEVVAGGAPARMIMDQSKLHEES